MPTERALARARKDRREGKSASTQAGEFVREEIERLHEGRDGVRSPAQAVAIGLSQARRAGIKVPAKKRALRSKRSRATAAVAETSVSKAVPAKRKTAAKKATRTRSTGGGTRTAGATRAARTRAMRARTR